MVQGDADQSRPDARDASGKPGSISGGDPPAIEAGALLGGGREVVILHRGARYRLRVTQSDKLILTK